MGSAISQVKADSPVEAEPPQMEAEEQPAPSAPKHTSRKARSLQDLSEDELEELKAEVVDEIVNKMAGETGEKLDVLLEPEIITAPYDPRFPGKNQARHCFVRFNEYYKCVFERGEDHPRCNFYQRAYQSICPSEWLEQWQEMREKGLWAGKY